MLNIFLASIASSIIFFGSGTITNYIIFRKTISELSNFDKGIFGAIFIAFCSLFINFFFPINQTVGTIFLLFTFAAFIFDFYFNKKKMEVIYLILVVSIISFVLVLLSNINRPDAGLYHLPFVNLINEYKIIIGSTNIHYRFGHTSLVQYISAIYYNHLFKPEFITLPIASMGSFFIFFLLKNFFLNLKKNNLEKYLIYFLVIVFSLYSFNRYSNYGNDTPAHIYFIFFILIYFEINDLRKIESIKFVKLLLISIFLIGLKIFMTLSFILLAILFLLNKEKLNILKNGKLYISLLLFLLLIIKNILISGCALFPFKETCLTNLTHFNKEITKKASEEAEAWSKDVPNSKKNYGSYSKYNANFNWVSTWLNNHFNKILEKLIPYIILLFLVFLISIIRKIYFNQKSNLDEITGEQILLIVYLLFCCLVWFLKFPLYRFGTSFLFLTITFSFLIFMKSINLLSSRLISKNLLITLIIFGFIGFLGKNFIRIGKNIDKEYFNYPWPKIYTLGNNNLNQPPKFKLVKDQNNRKLYYFSEGKECMYSNSPCSHMLNENLKVEKKLGFLIYSTKIF